MPPTPYTTDYEVLNQTPTSGFAWNTYPSLAAYDADKLAVRARLILDASSWVDTEAGQKLYATHDSETLLMGSSRRVSMREGRLFVQTQYSPLISVESVLMSPDGATWNAITNPTIVLAGRSAFWVTQPYATGYYGWPYSGGFVQVNYTDGYPNSALQADVLADASSLSMVGAVGMRPGGSLTIYDGDLTEEVVIDLSYVPESLTVPLAAPLVNDHVAGTAVSAIPYEVRYTTRLVIEHMVRLRTQDAIAAGFGDGGSGKPNTPDTSGLEEARDRLKAYRRQV